MNSEGDPIIDGAARLRFPVHRDHRGALVAFDAFQGLPFALKRAFCVFDVPAGQERAGHAISSDCVILATVGAFDLHLANGRERATVRLDDPGLGVHVQPGIHLRATGFLAGSVMLVLASQHFSEVRYADEPFFYG